jgi:putative transcriptional regulator
MSEAFESIKQGLREAIEHAQGRNVKALMHERQAVDVRAIRQDVGMTQSQFAASLGVSLTTLRHWERGDSHPHGPALVLLHVVAREPEAVLRALRSDRPDAD